MSVPAEPGIEIFEGGDTSLLDLVDNLLNQGVVLTGDVVLGLAGVDLVYLRLSLLLCASDRILPRREREAPEEEAS
ncbi:MAG TPA: gas vesicle protein GvpJ [Thermoanaerobaculia bacterium]|nr:gas vesicle protein GvpJ [Thermoanaerobaculia bacterium]